jgi:hypothetical protein
MIGEGTFDEAVGLGAKRRAARYRHVFVALFAVLLLSVGLLPRFASAEACRPDRSAPRIIVTAEDAAVHYHYDASSKDLVARAASGGLAARKGEAPIGLTLGRYGLDITAQVDFRTSGNVTCAALRGTHVTVGLKQLDVLVDRRYAVGSCQREAVLAHEAQHVAVFREALLAYLPLLVQRLASAPLPQTFALADRGKARSIFLDAISAVAQPILTAIDARANAANAALDTEASYADVARRCAEW